MSDTSLKDKTAKGMLWGGLSNGAQQVLNLAFGIVLANLLTPEDYGMVGMLTIFSLVAATIQESGFTAALTNRPSMVHRDYNAVFWFCLPVSLTLYGVLFAAAPLIADFYSAPELTPLARYLFLTFVISGLGIVPSARLFKTLRVKERTLSNLIALMTSGGVGITLASLGYSYWGIATQTLVYVTANTTLYWWFAKWRPTLAWDFAPIREMLGFSSKLLVTNIFNHINNNFFSLVLGRFYADTEVGHYNQANKWNFMGHSMVTGVVNGVAQPLFVETGGDRERQARVFRKMMRFTCFLAFPVMLGLAIVAHELILLTITSKWLVAADMLSMLCVSGAFLPVTALYTQFLLSRGSAHIYMWGLIALVCVQLSAAVAVYPYGVMTMLAVYVGINLAWIPVWHYFVRRTLGIGYRQGLLDIAPFLLAAGGTMAATCHIVAWLDVSLLGALLLKIPIAALLYTGILWLSGAKILKESWDYLVRKKR